MEQNRYEKEDLQEALRVLREGGVIVYPTDTVWGIGCDATNAEAVKKIYALKQREDSKSMLVLLDSPAKLNYYIADIPDSAWALLIRITGEPFSKALCEQLRHPIVSTSANISGHPTAHFFHEIEQAILDGADYVCQFRRNDDCPHEPSSIIKINNDGSFKIIRP